MSGRCEHCNGSGLSDKEGPRDDELLDRVVLSAVAIDGLLAEVAALREALELAVDRLKSLDPYVNKDITEYILGLLANTAEQNREGERG